LSDRLLLIIGAGILFEATWLEVPKDQMKCMTVDRGVC